MQPLHFFLGANSGEGFYSLYDQLLNGRFDDLLILKGGPGCGKSTFMRRAGAAMEQVGERVVYINCSGDPDSLDGAIFLCGNAPLALAGMVKLALERGIRPALIVGMPVGFVNVVESKELLKLVDVPYIVLRGRRGGSRKRECGRQFPDALLCEAKLPKRAVNAELF